MALITGVEKNSPAGRAGLRAGWRLVSVSGRLVQDILDYRFYTYDAVLTLTAADENGLERVITLRKGEGEDLGLSFETYLMDRQHACDNQCLFCFVDQLPPSLRRSLYFKDDDARLSFLRGQYITLTSLEPEEFKRILKQRISPLHISVHATDPELRARLLGHPEAGKCLSLLRRLAAGGIELHTQVVVCPGLNDGPALTRTLTDLTALFPAVRSVSVVPVGLTRWREGLYPLTPFDRQGALDTIGLAEELAGRCRAQYGLGIVYAADELYLLAGLPLPNEDTYDGYPQLENGVGMMTSFAVEFREALDYIIPSENGCWKKHPPSADGALFCERGQGLNTSFLNPLSQKRVAPQGQVFFPFTVATGIAAAPFLRGLLSELAMRIPCLDYTVVAVPNRLFGETITVAGLLCGRDLIDTLRGHVTGERVLIPASMLRHGGDVFLDDLTPDDVARAVGAAVVVVPVEGQSLVKAIVG